MLFKEGVSHKSLQLRGDELIDIIGLHQLRPRMDLALRVRRASGAVDQIDVICRVDTLDEVEYYRHGGILHYVLRGMATAA